jgi:hypothetical protein
MLAVQFLGGPWHGKEQLIDGEPQVTVCVKDETREDREAVYVFHTPTGQYVFGSYFDSDRSAN